MGDSGEAGEGKTFASVNEVFTAYSHKKLGTHARIYVRLPMKKKFISELRIDKDKTKVDVVERRPNGLVSTTVGRVIFNSILHADMAYYDLSLSSKYLQRIIADSDRS